MYKYRLNLTLFLLKSKRTKSEEGQRRFLRYIRSMSYWLIGAAVIVGLIIWHFFRHMLKIAFTILGVVVFGIAFLWYKSGQKLPTTLDAQAPVQEQAEKAVKNNWQTILKFGSK